MEVMIGAGPAVEVQTRRFLSGFRIIPLTSDVAERAVVLRQRYRVKLPDAVIWASAGVHSMLLVTRTSKDFSPDIPGIRMPYTLSRPRRSRHTLYALPDRQSVV